MKRLLCIEAALAALLLAPLAGYAIAYLLAGESGQVTRVMPPAPVLERGA